MKYNFTISELKEACRLKFDDVAEMDFINMVDKIFLLMGGSELEDDTPEEQLKFKSCCYYNGAVRIFRIEP